MTGVRLHVLVIRPHANVSTAGDLSQTFTRRIWELLPTALKECVARAALGMHYHQAKVPSQCRSATGWAYVIGLLVNAGAAQGLPAAVVSTVNVQMIAVGMACASRWKPLHAKRMLFHCPTTGLQLFTELNPYVE